MNKRIEYIDALRGFCMYLVVYSHVWTYGYKADSSNSFDHILVNFFLALFFFVSGFVAYKKDFSWTIGTVTEIWKRKFVQLIIPSVIFCALFCWQLACNWKTAYNPEPLLGIATSWYWFTVQLFIFFVFYTLTMLMLRHVKSDYHSFSLIVIALLIYCISFSHTIIEKTQIGADLFLYLGMKHWRLYVFFIMGVLMRKHISAMKKCIEHPMWMSVIVMVFFLMVFCSDHITLPFWKPIGAIVYGGVSILLIFAFFYKHQTSFSHERILGRIMQYVGKRTLDVYMIHYFILPRHLKCFGQFFSENVNPVIEFFVTSIIVLLIIAVSVLIGNILRLSPFLSHYLLGEKRLSKTSIGIRTN